jgi:hypothetical protein
MQRPEAAVARSSRRERCGFAERALDSDCRRLPDFSACRHVAVLKSNMSRQRRDASLCSVFFISPLRVSISEADAFVGKSRSLLKNARQEGRP